MLSLCDMATLYLLRGNVEAAQTTRTIEVWARLGLECGGVSGLLGRIWELRREHERLRRHLRRAGRSARCVIDADGRLGRAPGPRCTITIVRR